MGLYAALRPLLFLLPPEDAHRLALTALKLAPLPSPRFDPRLARRVAGIDFPSLIGIAPGFDKDGEAIAGTLALGFGFVEIGGVTPRPQPGNPRPRLFRLTADSAVINRFGFNNKGGEVMEARLRRERPAGVVGVNIGVNRDSTDRVGDYVAGVRRFAPLASYLTLNISSPNTKGLRDLQEVAALRDLLGSAREARDAASGGRKVPLFVKLAPDLSDEELADIAELVLSSGIEGAILTNTTIGRKGVTDAALAAETGGLSGRPLFRLSTIKLARFRKLVGPRFPLIGAGGIDSGETAWAKLAAGADLVQLYTGFIYRGPSLPREIAHYVTGRMEKEGLASLDAIIGSQTDRWAGEKE